MAAVLDSYLCAMKVSGFSYIRNGFTFEYPFIQSIRSVLPVCDEFVVAVGDSTDGTRQAIDAIGDHRIRIIDTVWDENLRASGKIFAQQSNIALAATTGDWCIHIQADEVVHENHLEDIARHLRDANNHQAAEGLLFDFLNFYGSYRYLNDSRYQHRKEVRAFRNGIGVRSYRDSQGFRKYPFEAEYASGHPGEKLRVVSTGIPYFHYSYVRSPERMAAKAKYFERFWHDDEYVEKKYGEVNVYDFSTVGRLKPFVGTHPAVMHDTVATEDWVFEPDRMRLRMSLKSRLYHFLDDLFGRRIGEYQNYILVKR